MTSNGDDDGVCLSCGMDWNWCPHCEMCACWCMCWTGRPRRAAVRARIWLDEQGQGTRGQHVETIRLARDLEGKFLWGECAVRSAGGTAGAR